MPLWVRVIAIFCAAFRTVIWAWAPRKNDLDHFQIDPLYINSPYSHRKPLLNEAPAMRTTGLTKHNSLGKSVNINRDRELNMENHAIRGFRKFACERRIFARVGGWGALVFNWKYSYFKRAQYMVDCGGEVSPRWIFFFVGWSIWYMLVNLGYAFLTLVSRELVLFSMPSRAVNWKIVFVAH